jgi:hypothetical protein
MNENKKELLEISKDIRDILQIRRDELELSFIEDTHTYYMRNMNGEIKSDFPSVSTVIKQFYEEFPALEKSLSMCNGDIFEQDKLLNQWRGTSEYANSKGSRTHYLLESDLLKMYGSYKDVRQPIFECDAEQIKESNAMIDAGHKFIQLMHRRGAVLLDTEIVLGSPELGYTGQPDKVWVMFNEKGELGIVITDWKGLPLDTPIFTDSGWKTMGTLTKSDMVYDKDGNLVDILNISEVKNKKCLKITFDNKEEIVSDFEHRWLVFTESDDIKKEMVMTTQEIKDYYSNSEMNTNLKIGLTKPLNNDKIDLVIDPYEFGNWLANDKTNYDIEIPDNYLNSSYEQRLSILKGYHAVKRNDITYNVNKKNILVMLLSSLGYNVYVKKLNSGYEINYNYNEKTIVSIEEVESVPTKCIEVDSPSSTFLYGHTFSVTHNTNKTKNFEVQPYTVPMLHPFDDYMDTALTHYMIQLPLYGRLLLDMLKTTKYENIKLFGCVIVHLLDTAKHVEYRVPKSFINTVLTMDPLMRIDEVKKNKKENERKEKERILMLEEARKKIN